LSIEANMIKTPDKTTNKDRRTDKTPQKDRRTDNTPHKDRRKCLKKTSTIAYTNTLLGKLYVPCSQRSTDNGVYVWCFWNESDSV